VMRLIQMGPEAALRKHLLLGRLVYSRMIFWVYQWGNQIMGKVVASLSGLGTIQARPPLPGFFVYTDCSRNAWTSTDVYNN
jgi:hypothetical protein